MWITNIRFVSHPHKKSCLIMPLYDHTWVRTTFFLGTEILTWIQVSLFHPLQLNQKPLPLKTKKGKWHRNFYFGVFYWDARYDSDFADVDWTRVPRTALESDQAILLWNPAPEGFSAFCPTLSILFSSTQTYVLPLCTAYYIFLERPSVLHPQLVFELQLLALFTQIFQFF